MSAKPISDKRLMSFEEASEELGGMHPNTIRQRKGGTESLTHVSGFGRRVFLVRSEVMELVERKIVESQARDRKHLHLVAKAI